MVTDELEYIRTQNASGINLWSELNTLAKDLNQELDWSRLKHTTTVGEREELLRFWCEQFEQNISLTVREQ